MKLTMNQEKRLRALLRLEMPQRRRGGWNERRASVATASTKRLVELGLVEMRGGKMAQTGRAIFAANAYITQAGREWLEAHPPEQL